MVLQVRANPPCAELDARHEFIFLDTTRQGNHHVARIACTIGESVEGVGGPVG